VTFSSMWSNDGTANVRDPGSGEAGLASDIVATPVYNRARECTSHAQGGRKPADFPWSL
jgi:hypothetical protein